MLTDFAAQFPTTDLWLDSMVAEDIRFALSHGCKGSASPPPQSAGCFGPPCMNWPANAPKRCCRCMMQTAPAADLPFRWISITITIPKP